MARRPRKRPKSKTLAALVLLAAAACSREASRSSAPPAKSENKPPVQARAEVGDPMPSYAAKFLDGKPFDVASEKGNVVLLNVWATWCQPCRFETPELQALHRKYGDRGFKVIGVSVDNEGSDAEIKQFIDENKITYPIAFDPEGRVANVLRTTVLPTSVLIGRDGRIAWRKVGAVMPNETAAVNGLIEKALGKKI